MTHTLNTPSAVYPMTHKPSLPAPADHQFKTTLLPGPLISEGPILVPAVSVDGVQCEPVPCMTTAPDCAPICLPMPLTRCHSLIR